MPRPLALLLAALVLLAPASAHAVVAPAALLDGPSADVLELGGVAMAGDGTGGVVWRRIDNGRPHVFVAQFAGGAWGPPQRVDVGPTQQFASSWPAIGAANGGSLTVAWVQEFGAADRMYAASLQPGARRFGPPVPIDLNVGDSALGSWPQIAMAPGGQALLTYRVITDARPGTVPPGNVLGEIRVAKFSGQYWSKLGVPMNRNPAAGQPAPNAENAPRVGIEQLGSGVVAWTELDDQFVPRVYSRRVFGSGSVSIARQVTPPELAGVRMRGVEGFDLSVGRFGEAAVVWRQSPTNGGDPARAFISDVPDQFASDAATWTPPRVIDGGGAAGFPGIGVPSVSMQGVDELVGIGIPGAALAVRATDTDVSDPVRQDSGDAAPEPATQTEIGSDGTSAVAWRVGSGGRQAVRLAARDASGNAGGSQLLSGPQGGGVDELRLGASGAGDAIAAFSQGQDAGRQLVAGYVDAPPQTFTVQTPLDWTRSAEVRLGWDKAVAAIGSVTYSVIVENELVAKGIKKTSLALKTTDLRSGKLAVSVIATDSASQETTSIPATLLLDRRRPKASVRVRGRRLTVTVTDSGGSKVDSARTSIAVGSRAPQTGKRTRRLRLRPGRYRVSVRSADKAGNTVRWAKTVTIR